MVTYIHEEAAMYRVYNLRTLILYIFPLNWLYLEVQGYGTKAIYTVYSKGLAYFGHLAQQHIGVQGPGLHI